MGEKEILRCCLLKKIGLCRTFMKQTFYAKFTKLTEYEKNMSYVHASAALVRHVLHTCLLSLNFNTAFSFEL